MSGRITRRTPTPHPCHHIDHQLYGPKRLSVVGVIRGFLRASTKTSERVAKSKSISSSAARPSRAARSRKVRFAPPPPSWRASTTGRWRCYAILTAPSKSVAECTEPILSRLPVPAISAKAISFLVKYSIPMNIGVIGPNVRSKFTIDRGPWSRV
jgi:hypothetical protein